MPHSPDDGIDGAAAAVKTAPARRSGDVVVLINLDSGTARRLGAAATHRAVAAAFAAHGLAATIKLVRGQAITPLARAALKPGGGVPPAILVAGGGDGTVRTLAQELAGSSLPLGILPLGTLNHFARDLGLPFDIDEAATIIAHGSTVVVDAAEVNGRIFVNNSSIGLYPAIVQDRDRQQRQGGRAKWLAMAVALLRVLWRPRARRLAIETAGTRQPRKTPFAFVGNNTYSLDLAGLGRRTSLSGGELCLFIANTTGRFGLLRLLLRAALGRLDQARDFERSFQRALVIHSRRRRVPVSLDGEVERLRPPLRYRILPGALRVLAPPRDPGPGGPNPHAPGG